jgi:hypothetical protein
MKILILLGTILQLKVVLPHGKKMIKEDIEFLEDWIVQIKTLTKELNLIAQKKDLTTYFSISNTTSSSKNIQKPYVTPIRLLEGGVICGVVVFSQSQAVIAAKFVQDFVDKILVDSEKKIGMQVGIDKNLLTYFKITDSAINSKSRSLIEFGNISSAVRMVIPEGKFIEYKANDITVDAIWTFLSIRLKKLSGKKIAILGCGNIGFKLALKLVESGINVILVRRDSSKGVLMANSINMVKPKTTLATATYCASPLQASSYCDVLIGTANSGVSLISWDMIQSMTPEGFVIDVGKGNVEDYAVKKAIEENIEIIRGDVGASLYGFISHRQQIQDVIKNKIGRNEIKPGVSVISGGLFGRNGEIVVDNYSLPGIVYGVANGCGQMKTTLNEVDRENLSLVKKHLSI